MNRHRPSDHAWGKPVTKLEAPPGFAQLPVFQIPCIFFEILLAVDRFLFLWNNVVTNPSQKHSFYWSYSKYWRFSFYCWFFCGVPKSFHCQYCCRFLAIACILYAIKSLFITVGSLLIFIFHCWFLFYIADVFYPSCLASLTWMLIDWILNCILPLLPTFCELYFALYNYCTWKDPVSAEHYGVFWGA